MANATCQYIAKDLGLGKDCQWWDIGTPATLVRWIEEGWSGVFKGTRHGVESTMQSCVMEFVVTEMLPQAVSSASYVFAVESGSLAGQVA